MQGQTPKPYLCLFIPGFFAAGPASFERAFFDKERQLHGYFNTVQSFQYDGINTSLEESARQLQLELTKAGLVPGSDRRLTIVAEGIGGLVARWFIEQEGGHQVVDQFIQLGTPNYGMREDDFRWSLAALTTLAVNGPDFYKAYLPTLILLHKQMSNGSFPTLSQLQTGNSDFLQRLGEIDEKATSSVKYHLIMGDVDRIDEKEIGKELRASNYLRTLRALTRGGLRGQTQIEAPPEFPNDLLVPVVNARQLPNNYEYYEVACDHLSYLHSPSVLEILEMIIKE
jgi:hypothetical protein